MASFMLEERNEGGGFRDRSTVASGGGKEDDGNPEQMENEDRYRQGGRDAASQLKRQHSDND